MTDQSTLTQLPLFPETLLPQKKPQNVCKLHTYWLQPHILPPWVRQSPTALRYLDLLGPLHWDDFPERNLQRNWGQTTIPYTAVAAATLIMLEEGAKSTQHLYRFLLEHPALIWLLGFPRIPAPNQPLGFNPRRSLLTQRHFNRLLRALPNQALQFLLTDSVRLILSELQTLGIASIECVSLDTKHILAWVKENNPKAHVTDRFNKEKQPRGDPDCRLGCKRRHNQITPTRNPRAASSLSVGEYYWGYASGIIATKVPRWGEFVLAELTQPFDQGDTTYFFPLMRQVEERLGYRPRIGTFDAAFDAWYVYAYFYAAHDPSRFAAVPFSEKGGYKANGRQFTPAGLPLCAAGLAMPLQFTYTDRTTCIVEHERGKYVCPLRFPTQTARACPTRHLNWKKGGCTVLMPTSIGARLRYTLDRDSESYKAAYRQRTALERINSQAVALGIERPHLRNGKAITNQNTLIYVLINLRFWQRLRARRLASD